MSCSTEKPDMLEHGGRLSAAAARYGIPVSEWLDLSTGINPNGWSVPSVPSSVWTRLPEDSDGLEQAAATYYGCESLLPVAGSQAAIQALPRLFSPARVSVLEPGYAEHAYAWQQAGHKVTPAGADEINDCLTETDILVLINPNNPTGVCFSYQQLRDWQAQLASRNGYLIVDEAFMDCTPGQSLLAHIDHDLNGLVILRSLGKFFGLAGARLGFVFAASELLSRLKASLGPWAVSAPTRYVATAALKDQAWQQAARQRLLGQGQRLQNMLMEYGLAPDGGCALFQWVCIAQAADWHKELARLGILTRLFTEPPSLRFGLPAIELDWQRMATALAEVNLKLQNPEICCAGAKK